MKFKQKHFATRIALEFGEDTLTYAIQDSGGRNEFDVPYVLVPKKSQVQFERNLWLRNVGLIWIALGVIAWTSAFLGAPFLSIPILWVAVGGACFTFYKVSSSAYTVFNLNTGDAIWVLQNKDHDPIIETLSQRRTEAALKWYSQTDFSDDIGRHKDALLWLVEQGALTKPDAEKRIENLSVTQAFTQIDHDRLGPQKH